MKKIRIILGIGFAFLFGAFTYLVRTYDVAAIGPEGTSIGFSKFNQFVHETTGVNMLWYNITDYLGYLAIAIAGAFAIIGVVQMIRRRSLFKVDREIIALGILFVIVIGLYIAFEKFIINYRPIIMEGDAMPEASYPSSHTMLIVTVIGAAIMLVEHYLDRGALRTILILLGIAIIIATIGGRLYCGVHWITDILGGLLLSIALLELYSAAITGGKHSNILGTSEGDGRGRRGSGARSSSPSTRGYVPKH